MDFFVKKTTTATGVKTKLVTSVTASITRLEERFVATAAQTVIQLAADLGPTQLIDVYVNGMNVDEGGSDDFTRDAALDRIIFNSGLLVGAKVKVILYVQ